MSTHRHRCATSIIVGYTGTVPRPVCGENRAAHGAVCVVETCACGAVRRTNSNGRHDERGAWIAP